MGAVIGCSEGNIGIARDQVILGAEGAQVIEKGTPTTKIHITEAVFTNVDDGNLLPASGSIHRSF